MTLDCSMHLPALPLIRSSVLFENALRYLARYVFKTATSNRPVPRLPDGRVRWSYRQSKSGKLASLQLEPMEFLRRFLQHILPPGFARVRTFGWLHPAAKVRGNRVRALLGEKPLLSTAEQQAWDPPGDPDTPPPQTPALIACASPRCPHCQRVMRLIGSFRRQAFLLPNRPP